MYFFCKEQKNNIFKSFFSSSLLDLLLLYNGGAQQNLRERNNHVANPLLSFRSLEKNNLN